MYSTLKGKRCSIACLQAILVLWECKSGGPQPHHDYVLGSRSVKLETGQVIAGGMKPFEGFLCLCCLRLEAYRRPIGGAHRETTDGPHYSTEYVLENTGQNTIQTPSEANPVKRKTKKTKSQIKATENYWLLNRRRKKIPYYGGHPDSTETVITSHRLQS